MVNTLTTPTDLIPLLAVYLLGRANLTIDVLLRLRIRIRLRSQRRRRRSKRSR